MNSESELSWSEIQKLADEIVFQVTGIHLSDVETKVLQGASEGKTYDKNPRALIGIKAPQEMGKTSVLERILAFSAIQNYQIVNLSFETNSNVFSNIHIFLRYFCACVSKQLGMPNKLDCFRRVEPGANN